LYLAEKTIEVKDLLSAYEAFRAGGGKKNQGKKAEGREEAIRRVMEIIEDIRGARDARSRYLPGHEGPFVDLGAVAASEEGRSPFP